MKKGRGLKIGVIGVGMMGENHARICSSLAGAKLFAVADQNEKRAREIGILYGAKAFKDYKEMLPLVEAVSIVTPSETHFEIARECLIAGKHILVEKPLAKTSLEAENLAELAKEKSLVLAVGLIERFNPVFQELCKLVKKEKIIGIHLKRLSPFPERITDANVVQDMMIHDIDLLFYLLRKEEIEDFKAEGMRLKSNKIDRANATFYFHSGIIAKIEADRIFDIRTRKIMVVTERSLIEADLLNKRIYIRDLQHHIPSVHYTKNYDQLAAELSDFVKAIKTGAKPKVDAEAGCRAIKFAEEVERACS